MRHISEVQQNLLRQDVYLPGFALSPKNNMACSAQISATSQERLRFPEPESYADADTALHQVFFANEVQSVALLLQNTGDETITAEVGLLLAKGANNLTSKNLVKTVQADVPPGIYWIEFPIDCRWERQQCIGLRLQPMACLRWGYSKSEPPAITSGREDPNGKVCRMRGTYCVRLTPDSFCYDPRQIVSGVNRPDTQSNIWIAEEGFPQTVHLQWPEPISFTQMRLTFDDNLDRPLRRITDFQVAPELIRDYEVYALENGRWDLIVQEKDNYLRHRVHSFQKVSTQEIRIVMLSSNGCKHARLVECQIDDSASYNKDNKE